MSHTCSKSSCSLGLPRWLRGVESTFPVQSLGGLDPLQKEIATYSSIPAWETPWIEEPGGLQSMGLQESDMTW